jgi:hypothetical protein
MNKASATVPVQSMQACVVYDSTSGQIRHHHRVITLVGGREPTLEEIAADALRVLNSHLPNPSGGVLHVLHVKHDAIEPGKKYRVDPHKKELVRHA